MLWRGGAQGLTIDLLVPIQSPSQDEDAAEKLPDVALLDVKIAEAEKAIADGETTAEKRRAMERREDLMRLKRVEQIYVRAPLSPAPARSCVPDRPSFRSRALCCLSFRGGCSYC